MLYIIKCEAIWESSSKRQKSRKEGFYDTALKAIKKAKNKTHRDIQMTFWRTEKDIRELIKKKMVSPGKSKQKGRPRTKKHKCIYGTKWTEGYEERWSTQTTISPFLFLCKVRKYSLSFFKLSSNHGSVPVL